VVVCHCGDPRRAERDLAPLIGFGSPVVSQVGPMPYPEMNRLLDAAYPAGALNCWRSSFLADLSDDAIEVLVEHFAAAPSPMMQLAIESFHGVVGHLAYRQGQRRPSRPSTVRCGARAR
jgi:hypothetical protein